MANFAYVEDDQIVGIYDDLPQHWANVSNFYLLSNELDYIRTFGWYPIVKQDPEYDHTQFRPGKLVYNFDADNNRVVETREIEALPPPPPERTPEQIAADTAAAIANMWTVIRQQRDQYMREMDWRYIRLARQQRLGIATTDSLAALDTYMQALADVTTQQDPFNIVWPVLE